MLNNLTEELKNRNLFHQSTNIEEHLKTPRTIYVGFDPTAESLHIGNLAPIQMMKIAQKQGHKVVALIGGATGMIGDPSGKSSERKFLTKEDLLRNQRGIEKQLKNLLPGVQVINNMDWFENISLVDFLRDVGKFQTVNQMMSRDSVKNRIHRNEGDQVDEGISFTEFTYQLIQAKDFEHLFKHDVSVQMGGSDQWGNMTTGVDLIRRKLGHEKEAHAITCPLITKADGGKFGKTEKGNVWLDPNRTSPYEFYQFWINQTDEDAEKFIKIFTLMDIYEIQVIVSEHKIDPSKRILQKKLAEEITKSIHGQRGVIEAQTATQVLFTNKGLEPLKTLDKEEFLRIFQNVPKTRVFQHEDDVDIPTLLSELTNFEVFKSKSDVRRMIKNNGLKINKTKVIQSNTLADFEKINDHIIIQKGKKNFHLINFK